jgi:hypothetical protein
LAGIRSARDRRTSVSSAGRSNQITPRLQIGTEVYHQTADTTGGKASTGVGFGAIYNINETYHLLSSIGPGIQNARETNQLSWDTALLLTF